MACREAGNAWSQATRGTGARREDAAAENRKGRGSGTTPPVGTGRQAARFKSIWLCVTGASPFFCPWLLKCRFAPKNRPWTAERSPCQFLQVPSVRISTAAGWYAL